MAPQSEVLFTKRNLGLSFDLVSGNKIVVQKLSRVLTALKLNALDIF